MERFGALLTFIVYFDLILQYFQILYDIRWKYFEISILLFLIFSSCPCSWTNCKKEQFSQTLGTAKYTKQLHCKGRGSDLAHSHLPPPLCHEEFNIVPRIQGTEDSSFL